MLVRLQSLLKCALLAASLVVVVQLAVVLAQVSRTLHSADAELRKTFREVQVALAYSQAVLSSARGTAETVRKSAVEQMGYYEAIGRRSALVLARLERLLAHTDARMERVAQSLEAATEQAGATARQAGFLAASLQEDLHAVSEQSVVLAQTSAEAVQQLRQRLADERLDQIAAALAESSEQAARASAHVAEASGYVRDILSPKRKSFWRRLLELFVPRARSDAP